MGTLGRHFGTYGLVSKFHHEGLHSSKMALSIESRMVSKFPGFVWITVKQTCRTKQRNEIDLNKVSAYKSQSKGRSIAGCRLLLRTLPVPLKKVANRDIWFFTERDWNQGCCHGNNIVGVILFLLWYTFLLPSLKNTAPLFLEIFLIWWVYLWRHRFPHLHNTERHDRVQTERKELQPWTAISTFLVSSSK